MKTLLDQITAEFLTDADSPAAQQAKAMGLVYKGYSRWVDPRTGKVTHKSTDAGAKLEPVGPTEPESEKGADTKPDKEPKRAPAPGERRRGKKISAYERNVTAAKFKKLYGLEYTEDDEKRDDKEAKEHAEIIRESDDMSRVLGLGEDRWLRGGGHAWQDDLIQMSPNYRKELFKSIDRFFEENDVRVEAPTIYRGMRFEHEGDYEKFMSQMVEGDTISLRPSGCSSDPTIALEFATIEVEKGGGYGGEWDDSYTRKMHRPVVVSVTSQDPKGLR